MLLDVAEPEELVSLPDSASSEPFPVEAPQLPSSRTPRRPAGRALAPVRRSTGGKSRAATRPELGAPGASASGDDSAVKIKITEVRGRMAKAMCGTFACVRGKVRLRYVQQGLKRLALADHRSGSECGLKRVEES